MPNKSGAMPMLAIVTIIAARLTTAVKSATISTAKYFPSRSCIRGTGDATSISSVPRSRSPAVRSIAG